MKKILNKGPVTNTNCACNESTAENDYRHECGNQHFDSFWPSF